MEKIIHIYLRNGLCRTILVTSELDNEIHNALVYRWDLLIPNPNIIGPTTSTIEYMFIPYHAILQVEVEARTV